MSRRLALRAGRFVAVFLMFILLSEAWDTAIDGENFAIDPPEVITALFVAAIITFWRARQDRRRSRISRK